jgi:hypothetical protein
MTGRYFDRLSTGRVLVYLHALRNAPDNPTARAFLAARGEVLRTLAQPYSDHPDYRDEWDTVTLTGA